MVAKGMAYPTFYDGMFYDLRELFSKATKKAREQRLGVWDKDRTNTYTKIASLGDITENHVILPKLFRRLTAYIKDKGGFNAEDFVAKLEQNPEKVLILSILHFTHLDNLISINASGKIKLKQQPENLVFLS